MSPQRQKLPDDSAVRQADAVSLGTDQLQILAPFVKSVCEIESYALRYV